MMALKDSIHFTSIQLDADDVERHMAVQSNIALECTISQVIKWPSSLI